MLGTKAQYAALRGCSKAYLSKANVAALLESAMEIDPSDGKKKINFTKADKILDANRDPAQPDRRKIKKAKTEEDADDGKPKYAAVKTNRELLKLENDQLDLMKRKGETLMRQDVVHACAAAGQKIQELQRACSLRLAEKFSTMNDARQIKTMMDEEFRNMNQAIHDDLMRKIGQDSFDSSIAAH